MDPKLPIRSIDYTVIFARQMADPDGNVLEIAPRSRPRI